MTDTERPPLADQIQAVEWAEEHVRWVRRAKAAPNVVELFDRTDVSERLERGLEAAAETLRTLEFGSEIAR